MARGLDGELLLSRHVVYLKLRDKAAGMPYVGSLTIINAQGRLINFSRQWPTPNINAADRDFFKAFQSNPSLTSFIGRADSQSRHRKQGCAIARKISGPNSEFLGVTTAAIELQYFQKYLGEISLDPDNAVTLFRQDGMVLARFPPNDSIIGRRFASERRSQARGNVDHGVGVRRRRAQWMTVRMVAAHRVGGFPIVVTTSKTNRGNLCRLAANRCIRDRDIGADDYRDRGVCFAFHKTI